MGADTPLDAGLGSIAVTWYHGFPDTEHDLVLVSTDDGLTTQLTSGTQTDSQAAWSPDGSTVAFWRVPRGGPPGAGSSNNRRWFVRDARIPSDDEDTYRAMRSGELIGIPQSASPAMRQAHIRLRTENLHDASLVAKALQS